MSYDTAQELTSVVAQPRKTRVRVDVYDIGNLVLFNYLLYNYFHYIVGATVQHAKAIVKGCIFLGMLESNVMHHGVTNLGPSIFWECSLFSDPPRQSTAHAGDVDLPKSG